MSIQEAIEKNNQVQKTEYSYYTIQEFKKTDTKELLQSIANAANVDLNNPNEISQINAWKDEIKKLKVFFDSTTEYDNYTIIFEYVIPYEQGRRPDVLIVSSKYLYILEFKQHLYGINPAYVDQVKNYALDFKGFHLESSNKEILPILVMSNEKDLNQTNGNVKVVSIDKLDGALLKLKGDTPLTKEQVNAFLNSKYEPNPNIISLALDIWENKEIPNIRKVNSSGIPQALEFINQISKLNSHKLILVSGVPGSGKTYLGLKFVYDNAKVNGIANSMYLTGNGPLEEVLHKLLSDQQNEGKSFIRGALKVIGEYIKSGKTNKSIHNYVFDEGQRAWDEEKMLDKYQVNKTENECLIEMCDKLEYATIVILVGDGQSIHKGEFSGVGQWDKAINKSSNKWEVYAPESYKKYFNNVNFIKEDKLELTKSLRSKASLEYSNFVNDFLSNVKTDLNKEFLKVNNNYIFKITRNLDKAKKWMNDFYENTKKEFGMVCSSKGNLGFEYFNKQRFGFGMKNYEYFTGKSNELVEPKDEFAVQGLELDGVIVCWDEDVKIKANRWDVKSYKQKSNNGKLELNPNNDEGRKNAYRVLLTRGRDCTILYIPKVSELDETFDFFKNLGAEVI